MKQEERRQAYLQAMGLEVFYPRRPVPGARKSPPYDLPAAPEALPDSAGSEHGTRAARTPVSPAPTPVARPAPARPERPEFTAQSRARAKPVAEPALPQPGPEAAAQDARQDAEPLRFSLRYWRINDSLSVIDEVPFALEREAQGRSRNLLQAILAALAIEVELPSQADAFSWPLVEEVEPGGNGSEHARQALTGFIDSCRERDGMSNLLVFSAQLDDLLPGANHAGAARDYESRAAGLHITRTHSLQTLLSCPELKPEVWQHLQALRVRLH